MEWKLFEGDRPHVSTFEFHEHRERAPHLEQLAHIARLNKAADFLRLIATANPMATWIDLGCGDGGLLSLVGAEFEHAWGYDFAPANVAGWRERGVEAYAEDVFNGDFIKFVMEPVTVVSCTEVLEHLANPHQVVADLRERAKYLVASSPANEDAACHAGEHAWAWDNTGYAKMIMDGGWRIMAHHMVWPFQVVLAAHDA